MCLHNHIGDTKLNRLVGKVAIITGASSGIGYKASQLFVQEGAKVILIARRESILKHLCNELNVQQQVAHYIVGDISNPQSMLKAIDLANHLYGRLDIAFNNAATVGEYQLTHETTDQNWNSVIQQNLTAAFQSARAQLKIMLQQQNGCIIFTSSFVGYHVGFPHMAAYAASKAGLIGLTKVMAAEYGPLGIRVNALLPGGTDTPMGQEATATPDSLAFVQHLHALKRLAQPEEIAQAALFLASDEASFITGSTLLVDGGISITRS